MLPGLGSSAAAALAANFDKQRKISKQMFQPLLRVSLSFFFLHKVQERFCWRSFGRWPQCTAQKKTWTVIGLCPKPLSRSSRRAGPARRCWFSTWWPKIACHREIDEELGPLIPTTTQADQSHIVPIAFNTLGIPFKHNSLMALKKQVTLNYIESNSQKISKNSHIALK